MNSCAKPVKRILARMAKMARATVYGYFSPRIHRFRLEQGRSATASRQLALIALLIVALWGGKAFAQINCQVDYPLAGGGDLVFLGTGHSDAFTGTAIVAPGASARFSGSCSDASGSTLEGNYSWTVQGSPLTAGRTATINAPATPGASVAVVMSFSSVAGTGTVSFNVQATVAAAPTCTLSVNPPTGPYSVGQSITLNASCTGGAATSYHWTLAFGGSVPDQQPVTTVPSVSFTIPQGATFVLQYLDPNGPGGLGPTVSNSFPVVAVLVLSPATLPPGTVNVRYMQSLSATGGTAPYAFVVTSGKLPDGLSLINGTISGVPTSAGSSNFTVAATDGRAKGNQAYTLTIANPVSASGISYVSGDKQAGTPGAPLPNPLVVKVVDTQNRPFADAQFATPQISGGTGTLTQQNARPSDGVYRFGFQLGPETTTRTINICLANAPSQCVVFQAGTIEQKIVVPAKSVVTPQAVTAVNTPTIQLSNVRQRLDQLRLQRNASVAEGLRISYAGQTLPLMTTFDLAKQMAGKPSSGGGASADKPDPFERWGVFVNGDVDVGKQSTVDAQNGFKITSRGLTLGADYRFPGNHVLGASLGLLKAETDLDAGAGDQDAKGYSISFYGSYIPITNAYVDGIINIGHNKYDSNRRLTSGDTATSDTRGNQWGVSISAGYALIRESLSLTPYGRLEYVDAKVNGFTENGNPDEALIISGQHIKATTLSIGGQASYSISTAWGVLIPNGRLEYSYLANRSAGNVDARLVGDDLATPSVPIAVLGEDRSFGTFAGGISAIFQQGISAFFNYEQLFGKRDFSDRHFTLGLRVQF